MAWTLSQSGDRRRYWGRALLVALAVVAYAPDARADSAVAIGAGTLTITGDGTGNELALTVSGSELVIADATGDETGPAACTDGAGDLRCPLAGLTTVTADLGGGADKLTVAADVFLPVTANGGAGTDELQGGPRNDTLDGGSEGDTLRGNGNADTLRGQAGIDTLEGGPGVDVVEGGTEGDLLDGGSGDDTLRGQAGADQLHGGPGNDELDGGTEADVVQGDDGVDRADYSALATKVTVTIGSGANDGADGEGDDVQSGTENVRGGSAGDDLTGDAASNLLDGGGGVDVLHGGAGGDVLRGGFLTNQVDTLDGGPGDDDVVDYSDRAAAVLVTLDGVVNDGSGNGAEGDVLQAVEGVIGSQGNDTLIGSDGDDMLRGHFGVDTLTGGAGNDVLIEEQTAFNANTLDGGPGADRLKGGGGAETLSGGAGDDVIDGGLGADTLTGGDGFDTASYATRAVRVVASIDGAGNDGVSGEGDSIQNDVEAIEGGIANDALTGGPGSDVLLGGAGPDTLDGGAGDDVLAGGVGADTLTGGAGFDSADYGDMPFGVIVTLDGQAGDGLPGEGDNVVTEAVLGGSGADNLTGDAGPNLLAGGPGGDVLAGGGGDDTLDGGGGADDLNAGAGADHLLAADGEVDVLRCAEPALTQITADDVDDRAACPAAATTTPAPGGPLAKPAPFDPAAFADLRGSPAPIVPAVRGGRPRAALLAALSGRPRSITVRRAAQLLRLGRYSCPRSARRCAVSIVLRRGKRAAGGGFTSIRPGRRATVTATLNSTAARLGGGTLTVAYTIAEDATTAQTSASVSFRRVR